MTTAEHNAQLDSQINELIAVRAQYDTIARSPVARVYTDNANEQAARITGEIARLRSMRRN